MSRRAARDYAYKLVFEYIFRGERADVSYDLVCADPSITAADKQYVDRVYNGVLDHYDELVLLISSNTTGFNPERIFKPDLAALLVAAYEMKYMDDIPMPVSVSEVLELVKSYSTEKSASFVNGGLAGIYKSLKKE